MRILGISLALAVVSVTTTVRADQAQDVAAVQNFRLTDNFLAKYMAVQDDAAQDVCRLAPAVTQLFGQNAGKSLDQMAAEYDAHPGVHAMLARHGLTAREEILGMINLLRASVAVVEEEHPGLVHSTGKSQLSPANLAFYESHAAAIHQHELQLEQQELKANHGKLPPCLTH